MALQQKLTDGDKALLEILSDPVWFGEFMRSTRDGQMRKQLWPAKPFTYRWYQKDVLTLQPSANPRLILRGGRAIGKCQPETTRILTTDGWKTIGDLVQAHRRNKSRGVLVELYAMNEQGALVRSPAYVAYDGDHVVYEIVTKSGYRTRATRDHPFLTPQGYMTTELLQAGQRVAILAAQPDTWCTGKVATADEWRLLGYLALVEHKRKRSLLVCANEHVLNDISRLAYQHSMTPLREADTLNLLLWYRDREKPPLHGTLAALSYDVEQVPQVLPMHNYRRPHYMYEVPGVLVRECTEHVIAFLSGLFAQWATLEKTSIRLIIPDQANADIIRVLLARIGVWCRIEPYTQAPRHMIITIDHPVAVARFYRTVPLAGVVVKHVDEPPADDMLNDTIVFDEIISITALPKPVPVYAIDVPQHRTYIADWFISHNSVVLEDKILYTVLNHATELPQTKELLILTANEAQLAPLWDRLIVRSTTSPILAPFLENRVNRQAGILDYRWPDGTRVLVRARIAGKDNANLVGLHVPVIVVDEAQLFRLDAWTQASHCWNDWEPNARILVAGVPNGLRTSLLYYATQAYAGYSQYKVPAHNNPYYTWAMDVDNLRRYGGEESDEYQQLVLGEHGRPSFSVIQREQFHTEPFSFRVDRYTNDHVRDGLVWDTILEPPQVNGVVLFGIDTGYVDPTVIVVTVRGNDNVWRHVYRVVLQKIDFDLQQRIIHELIRHYQPARVAIDAGPGGGGLQIIHTLLYNDAYRGFRYRDIILPVVFNERAATDIEHTAPTKTVGALHLIRAIQDKRLVFSDIDFEAVSELERITKRPTASGADSYYILGESGTGASPNDHIFAAFICWAMAERQSEMRFYRRSLPKPVGVFRSLPSTAGGAAGGTTQGGTT
ncbi:MAG: hypothetical protein KatS3mg054_0346 [Chloroflexus sp.]|nr:MAG: hypothetical protein KatS3mg054_0346 [Chloroflexus sp.]